MHPLAVGFQGFKTRGVVIAIAAGETILLVEQDLAAGIVALVWFRRATRPFSRNSKARSVA